MNCEKVEQLIPLFVEADLDAAELQQVSEHLDVCVACSHLAAEFHASQAMLHCVARPEFDEAIFAEMRIKVQHAVVRTATQPSLTELLNPIWNWKFAFATAAAVLLLVGSIVMNSRSKTVTRNSVASNEQRKVADSHPAEVSPDKTVVEHHRQPAFSPPRMGRKKNAQGGVSSSERNPTWAIPIDPQISAAASAPAGATDSFASGSFMLPPAAQAEDALLAQEQKSSSNLATSSEPEMLRMEIQTADPNIKIIWLTPKETIAAQRNPAAESK